MDDKLDDLLFELNKVYHGNVSNFLDVRVNQSWGKDEDHIWGNAFPQIVDRYKL